MNLFVHIRRFKTYEKVAFYAFHIADESENEAEKFFSRFEHEKGYEEDLNNLVAWIEEIGEIRGVKQQFFRFEESADALPPPARYLAELPVKDLRLYCLRLSEQIVILANGGIKTAQKVQDCPDLLPKFRLANQLAKKITQMIIDKEIEFSGKLIHDFDSLIIEI